MIDMRLVEYYDENEVPVEVAQFTVGAMREPFSQSQNTAQRKSQNTVQRKSQNTVERKFQNTVEG